MVARPGAEKGYQEVMELAKARSTAAHGADVIGPEQVQRKLGKQPANVETKDRYLIETYNWRGGALVKSHFVKVIYTGHEKPLLYTALLNEEPNEDNLPMNKLISADEADVKPENGPTGIGPPGGTVRPPSGATPPVPNDAQPDADKPAADKPDADKPAADKPDAKRDSDEPKS